MTVRFNHMELTYGRGALDAGVREDIGRFYGDVFGWASREAELFGQTNFVLLCDETSQQFLLLAEVDDPIAAPGLDHLGVHCDTPVEVDEILERCRRQQDKDDRVQLKVFKDLVTGPTTTHAFYVKYLLPIWIDVQCNTYEPGHEPVKRWTYG